MADEFLTKFYLGLHDLLAASVLTPRERKLIEIINTQNAVLEQISVGTLTRSPQEIADLAKGATVVIVEKGIAPAEPEPAPKPVDKTVEERIGAFSAGPAAGKPKLVDLLPSLDAPTTVGGGLAPPQRRYPEG